MNVAREPRNKIMIRLQYKPARHILIQLSEYLSELFCKQCLVLCEKTQCLGFVSSKNELVDGKNKLMLLTAIQNKPWMRTFDLIHVKARPFYCWVSFEHRHTGKISVSSALKPHITLATEMRVRRKKKTMLTSLLT